MIEKNKNERVKQTIELKKAYFANIGITVSHLMLMLLLLVLLTLLLKSGKMFLLLDAVTFKDAPLIGHLCRVANGVWKANKRRGTKARVEHLKMVLFLKNHYIIIPYVFKLSHKPLKFTQIWINFCCSMRGSFTKILSTKNPNYIVI